jgi:chromate transporter
MPPEPSTLRRRLTELAGLFLKLGSTAFGGPAAHLAMMEAEVVRRRQWLTREEFLDLLGATNLIPGPNSTEMAIHIGHRRAGWAGLVVAGVCFIVPAMLIMFVLAWAYQRYGAVPELAGILYGVKPVIIAVVVQALWGLGRTAVKSRALAVLGVGATALGFLGINELLLLFVAGAVMAMRGGLRPGNGGKLACFLPVLAAVPSGAAAAGSAVAAATPFTLGGLFLFFAKTGSVLFGSGYVLLAFLRNGLVERSGWMTEAQLLDAVAVGQMVPGPVFTTATFIGYQLGGVMGGFVATAGIFLPAFFFVAVSGPLVPRLRRSPVAGAFLDGVNVASLALMVVVTAQLGRAALVDVPTLLLALAGAVLLLRWKVNVFWLVIGGAAAGVVTKAVGAG